ncbi:MAG: monovalent cation/H(+) antiporter subunit G [Gemmatimonadota bacterium]
MAIVIDIASWVLIVLGVLFMVAGSIGVNRLPDVFTRQHAAGMTDTAGAGLLLTGLILQAGVGLNAVRLLFILLFVAFTSPISTHATCRAALEAGIEPVRRKEGGVWTS